jgi:hypothetical protein
MPNRTNKFANEVVTAARFIGYLKTLPPDTPIVMSRDSEGNGYSVLTDFGVSLHDVADLDMDNHSTPLNCKQALVLYPD